MLHCYFGKPYVKDRIPDWIEHDFLQYVNKRKLRDGVCERIIKEVDNSVLLNDLTIESPVLGLIGLNEISGGAKSLILMYTRPDLVMRTAHMGDNCAKSLKFVATYADCHLLVEHAFKFDPDQVYHFPQYDVTVKGTEAFRSVKSRHYADYLLR